MVIAAITEEHVDKVCLLRQGEKTCSFLARMPHGWVCAKDDESLWITISMRRLANEMAAKGDNCDGWNTVFVVEKKEKVLMPTDVNKTDEMWSELHGLLKDMDVPPDRFSDINWLNRNLGIRNQHHNNYPRANQLIRDIFLDIRAEVRKHSANQKSS